MTKKKDKICTAIVPKGTRQARRDYSNNAGSSMTGNYSRPRPNNAGITGNIRVKDFELDVHRALERKLAACYKDHIEVEPCDPNNFNLHLSTAAFELCKQALIQCPT